MTNFKYRGNSSRGIRFSASMLAVIFSLALTSHAKDLQSYGGQGGDSGYRLECPPGALLTGFIGQAAAQISQLSIECRRIDDRKRSLGDVVSASSDPQGSRFAGRAPGGTQRRRACAEQQVIYTVDFLFARTGVTVLDRLRAGCMDVRDSRRPVTSFDFPGTDVPQAGDSLSSYPRSGWQSCPQGELPAGIHGTSRFYVDSIGLICRPIANGASNPEQDSQGIYFWPFATAHPAHERPAAGH